MEQNAARLLMLVVCLGAPTATLAAPGERPWVAEVVTDFPLQLGVGGRFDAPYGLRARTSVGWLPSPYLDVINDVAVSVTEGEEAGYTEDDAKLVRETLQNSLVWRVAGGWRPFSDWGFYFEGNYTLLTLGGGVTSGTLVSSLTGQSLPGAAGDQPFDASATLHMVGVEIGWTWVLTAIDPRLELRAAAGASFTVAAKAEVKQKGGSSGPGVSAFEDYAGDYLTDIFTSYVHAPLASFGVGWRF